MRAHGVTLNAAYTYSKAIDQASKLDGAEHVDAFNDSLSRGLADFDVRHRLAFTTLWAVPSPHGSGFMNKVLGGWELTNVTILQSGQPFSVFVYRWFSPLCLTTIFPPKVVGNTGCDYNADGTDSRPARYAVVRQHDYRAFAIGLSDRNVCLRRDGILRKHLPRRLACRKASWAATRSMDRALPTPTSR